MTAMTRLDYHKADVFVEIIDFGDLKGSEMVTPNPDGSYTILVNARKSFEAQQESVLHALGHIERNDFEKENVQQIEAVAHQIAPAASDIDKIFEEQRKDVTEELYKEPRYVQYEIEVREKLIKAQQEDERRRFELERRASFSQFMWDNFRDKWFVMLENAKLFGGI